MVDDNYLLCFFVKLLTFYYQRIMRIADNQQWIVRQLLHSIRRLCEQRFFTVNVGESVYQDFCKRCVVVAYRPGTLAEIPYGAGKAYRWAYAVKVAVLVTHYEYLVCIVNKLKQWVCDDSCLDLRVTLNALWNTAVELKAVVRLYSRLIAASSECHFKRLTCELFAFFQRFTCSADTYRHCYVKAVIHENFSCFIEDFDLVTQDFLQVSFFYYGYKSVGRILSEYACRLSRKIFEQLVYLYRNVSLFTFKATAYKLLVAVYHKQYDNGLWQLFLCFKSSYVGYVLEE